MTYTLWLGDCLEEMDGIEDGSIDLIFTSPPYYNAREYASFETYPDYLEFLYQAFVKFERLLKPARLFVLNVSCVIEAREHRNSESVRYPIPFDSVQLAQKAGFKFIDDIIWKKPDGASSRAIKFSHHRRPVAYKPFTVTEYILVFRKASPLLLDDVIRSHTEEQITKSLVTGEYERENVWSIPPCTSKHHPAVFPIELANKVIRYYSYIDDIILDPFFGSGTTLEAAMRNNRRSIGIEKDTHYFNVAQQRLERVAAELRGELNHLPMFAEVAA